MCKRFRLWFFGSPAAPLTVIVVLVALAAGGAVGFSQWREAVTDRRHSEILEDFDAMQEALYYQEHLQLQLVAMEFLFAGVVLGPSGWPVEVTWQNSYDPRELEFVIVDPVTKEVLYDGHGNAVSAWLPLSERDFGKGMFTIDEGELTPFRDVLNRADGHIHARLVYACGRGEDVPWCWYPPD